MEGMHGQQMQKHLYNMKKVMSAYDQSLGSTSPSLSDTNYTVMRKWQPAHQEI